MKTSFILFCLVSFAIWSPSAISMMPYKYAAMVGISFDLEHESNGTACHSQVFSIDHDASGLNVLSSASAKSSVLGRIRQVPEFGVLNVYAMEFLVTGYKNGWLRVNRAGSEYPFFLYDEKSQHGRLDEFLGSTGWVNASRTGVALESPILRSFPDHQSPSVVDGFDLESIEESLVISCVVTWTELKIRLRSCKEYRGWSSDVCASQLTTCS